MGVVPLQAPGLPVRVWPSRRVPLIVGSDVFAGATAAAVSTSSCGAVVLPLSRLESPCAVTAVAVSVWVAADESAGSASSRTAATSHGTRTSVQVQTQRQRTNIARRDRPYAERTAATSPRAVARQRSYDARFSWPGQRSTGRD